MWTLTISRLLTFELWGRERVAGSKKVIRIFCAKPTASSGIMEDDRFVPVHKHTDAGDERMLQLKREPKLFSFTFFIDFIQLRCCVQISSRRNIQWSLHFFAKSRVEWIWLANTSIILDSRFARWWVMTIFLSPWNDNCFFLGNISKHYTGCCNITRRVDSFEKRQLQI